MKTSGKTDYRQYLINRHEEANDREPEAALDYIGLRNRDSLREWQTRRAIHAATGSWPPKGNSND